jgi:hypothetical protein
VAPTITGWAFIDSKKKTKCFPGFETWQNNSSQCELIEIASAIDEIVTKLRGRV